MPPMDPERYQAFKASGRLPSPRGVALAVIRLLRRDDYKVAELVRLLQSDPAMAGRLLRFANSATFGNARPVVAIDQAIVLLGAHRVRDLVLGFSILHDFRNVGCAAFDFESFWSRSLAMAIAAQVLAKQAQMAGEEAFTLGLLCDVGMLALAAYDCDRYSEVLRGAFESPEQTIAAERAIFDTDHRELGAAMMTEWGLPETLVSAAFHSLAPDASGLADGSRPHKLALSLYFSRALAEVCVADAAERWHLLPELYGKAARLGIGPEDFAPLADDVVRRWHEWGTALRLQTHDMPPFAELLASVPPGEVAAVALPRRGAVIVGNDDPPVLELAGTLEMFGYEVTRASNGIDGLMVALRDRPQLIVVALDCEELDGTAFCRAFRASPMSRETHLMLLGSREQEDQLSHAVEAGADDYLLWPVSVATLRVRLRAADKIAHLREEIRRERRGLVRSAGEWAGSQRRMMEVAFTDLLTRLPNRRYGLDFLAAEWVFAHAYGRALACLMVDIDHFKAVNDDYGHDAGDAVLAGVARVIGELCRSEDTAFRYGGEEFCIVCVDTDMAMARIVAERIRGGVELERYTCGERQLAVTVSVGIAAISSKHGNTEALIKEADCALYRAKEMGRNRVEAME